MGSSLLAALVLTGMSLLLLVRATLKTIASGFRFYLYCEAVVVLTILLAFVRPLLFEHWRLLPALESPLWEIFGLLFVGGAIAAGIESIGGALAERHRGRRWQMWLFKLQQTHWLDRLLARYPKI